MVALDGQRHDLQSISSRKTAVHVLERSKPVNDSAPAEGNERRLQTSPHKGRQLFCTGVLSDFTLAPWSNFPTAGHAIVITAKTTASTSCLTNSAFYLRGRRTRCDDLFLYPRVVFGPPTVCLTKRRPDLCVDGITPPLGCHGDIGANSSPCLFFQFDIRVSKGPLAWRTLPPRPHRRHVQPLQPHHTWAQVNQLCDPCPAHTCNRWTTDRQTTTPQCQFA